MHFPYSPDDFDNPSLQKHYANIEAMALDRDAPEEVEDLTRKRPIRSDGFDVWLPQYSRTFYVPVTKFSMIIIKYYTPYFIVM